MEELQRSYAEAKATRVICFHYPALQTPASADAKAGDFQKAALLDLFRVQASHGGASVKLTVITPGIQQPCGDGMWTHVAPGAAAAAAIARTLFMENRQLSGGLLDVKPADLPLDCKVRGIGPFMLCLALSVLSLSSIFPVSLALSHW